MPAWPIFKEKSNYPSILHNRIARRHNQSWKVDFSFIHFKFVRKLQCGFCRHKLYFIFDEFQVSKLQTNKQTNKQRLSRRPNQSWKFDFSFIHFKFVIKLWCVFCGHKLFFYVFDEFQVSKLQTNKQTNKQTKTVSPSQSVLKSWLLLYPLQLCNKIAVCFLWA